jgi:hypothetical protein
MVGGTNPDQQIYHKGSGTLTSRSAIAKEIRFPTGPVPHHIGILMYIMPH